MAAPQADPRTLLPLVAVPASLCPAFAPLQGTVMHWIGPVRCATGAATKDTDRVGIVGDAAFYVCEVTGRIKRCVRFADLAELLVRDGDDSVGFRVAAPGEPSVLCRPGPAAVEAIVSAVTRVVWCRAGRRLPVTRLAADATFDGRLHVEKPRGWQLRVLDPLLPKPELTALLADHTAERHRDAAAAAAEFHRVKAALETAVGAAQARDVQRLADVAATALGASAAPPPDPAPAGTGNEQPGDERLRVVAAEVRAADAAREAEALRAELSAAQEAAAASSATVAAMQAALNDGAVPLSERVRSALAVAAEGTTAPPPPSAAAIIREERLRHAAEIAALRSEFERYDAEMRSVAADLLATRGPEAVAAMPAARARAREASTTGSAAGPSALSPRTSVVGGRPVQWQ